MAKYATQLFHVLITIFGLRILLDFSVSSLFYLKFLRDIEPLITGLQQPYPQIIAKSIVEFSALIALIGVYLLFEVLHHLVQKRLNSSTNPISRYPKIGGEEDPKKVLATVSEQPKLLATVIYRPLFIVAVLLNFLQWQIDLETDPQQGGGLNLVNYIIISVAYVLPIFILYFYQRSQISFSNSSIMTIKISEIYHQFFRFAFIFTTVEIVYSFTHINNISGTAIFPLGVFSTIFGYFVRPELAIIIPSIILFSIMLIMGYLDLKLLPIRILTVNGVSIQSNQAIVLSVIIAQLFFSNFLSALPLIPLNFYIGIVVLLLLVLVALFLLLTVLSKLDISSAVTPGPVVEPQMIMPPILLICSVMLEWYMISRPYVNI